MQMNGFMTPLSRGELFNRLGLMREVDPLIDDAYQFNAELEAEQEDWGHNRDNPWHVSFHGSSFPGNDPMACPRQALYKLMNLPRYSVDRRVVHAGEVGKAIEEAIVTKMWRAGTLLSPPPWERQWEFENKDSWLVCTTDAVTLHPRSNRPVVVEVKSRYDREIEAMIKMTGMPYDHEKFVRQLKCQIGMARAAEPLQVLRCYNTGRLAIDVPDPAWARSDGEQTTVTICPKHNHADCLHEVQLEPIEYGYILYVSRDDQTRTREVYFEHDEEFMQKGFEQLQLWQQYFLEGLLPQTNFDKSKKFVHPFGWRWTYQPCHFCDFGQECRADTKKAVAIGSQIALADSDGIEMAQRVRPDYAYERARDAVLKRWGLKPRKTAV